jgi:Carboxypeptidase regulatory-like domain/Doubled CXXCH motif (Paired_CXXCH_1)
MKNKLILYVAVLAVLAFSLIYSMDAEAVKGQKYFGDGAIPGPAGGWSYTNASDTNCFTSLCHVPNSATGAPDKTSYLMTGHKNALRKATLFSFWNGPDGLPYDTDSSGHVIFWNTPGPISLGTSTTHPPLLDGSCSLSGYLNQSACQTAGGTWTSGGTSLFYIYDGWMNTIAGTGAFYDPTTSVAAPGAVSNGGSYSCARCHTTGMTLDTAVTTTRPPEKTYPGINTYVNFDPDGNGPATTVSWGAGSSTGQTLEGVQCERCHDASKHFTNGPTVQRGVAATALCVQCHRQEHTVTYTSGGIGANIHPTPFSDNNVTLPVSEPTHPLPAIEVGRPDGSYAPMFFGYSTGMEFLNGVHGKFTGNFQQINNTANYNSGFSLWSCDLNGFASFSDQSSCLTAGGSWTDARGCTFNQTNCVGNAGTWTLVQGGCTTCHDVHNSLFVAAQKALAVKTTCQDCHVNNATTGATISTVPTVTIINHPTDAGSPFDTTKYDNACVVCHMATQEVKNGDRVSLPAHVWRINSSATYNTFPTMAQFYGGSCSVHTGAIQNAPSKPVVYLSDTSSVNCTAASGAWTVTAKTGSAQTTPDGSYTNAVWLDLDLACGQCHGGSIGTNATHNNAPYYSKAALALAAAGMHQTSLVSQVTPSTPVVSKGTMTATGYQVSFTDTSTNGDGSTANVSVNWGDGTYDIGVMGGTFTHTYSNLRARSYVINHMAISPGNPRLVSHPIDSFSVNVPQRYTVSGIVTTSTGTPMGSAYVFLKQSGHTKQYKKTLANGLFTFPNVLPGDYTVHVFKFGTTFGADATIPGLSSNQSLTISSTTP